MPTDPVCRMEVAKTSSELTSEHAGIMYYFCIPACKAAFDKEPHRYSEFDADDHEQEMRIH